MVKVTSKAALILGLLTLSSWGTEATQAAELSLGSSFTEWCFQKANLSTEVRKTKVYPTLTLLI